MEAIILNTDFEPVAVVDNFDSFIWTDRFCGCGDFELYLLVENAPEELLTLDNYVSLNGHDRLMIIEKIEYRGGDEDGDYVTVSGRSLESILSRRIIWTSGSFSSSKGLQTAILSLISDAIITGKCYKNNGSTSKITTTDSDRVISNFTYETSTDTTITDLDLIDGVDEDGEVYYWGENLYDVILSLCKNAGIGFKVLLNSGNFIFSLFAGADRSKEQTDNDWVVFSPEYGNVISTNYYKSSENYTNTYLATKDQNGSAYHVKMPGPNQPSGLARREIFVELSSSDDVLTEATMTRLANKELEDIKDVIEIEADPEGQFTYRTDYFVGDIVQVSDNYGHTGRKHISEVIMSEDESGESLTISFSDLDDD